MGKFFQQIIKLIEKNLPEILGGLSIALGEFIRGILKGGKVTEQEIIRLAEITKQLSQRISVLYIITIFAVVLGIVNMLLILL